MVQRHYNVRVYIEEVTGPQPEKIDRGVRISAPTERTALEVLNYKTQTNSLNTALERVQKVLELHVEESI